MFKGELRLIPQINMFGALSQIYHHCFEKYNTILKANDLRNSKTPFRFTRPIGNRIIDTYNRLSYQNNILHVFINSRTARLTKILMPFLSFADNLLLDNHTIISFPNKS